jgi:hypothetical protein
VALISRTIVIVSAVVGSYLFEVGTFWPQAATGGAWNVDLPIINLFTRWDGGQYASIAQYGYNFPNNPVAYQWCFLPLYPFLMRVLGTLLTGMLTEFQAVLTTGFLISNMLFFVNVVIFHKLSETVLKNSRLAFLSTVFFCFWPGSLFFSAVYTESLFMFFALGSFYLLEKKKHAQSVIFGFFAGLAKSSGFLVFIPYLYNGLQKRNYRLISYSFIIPVSYLLFTLYGYISTGVLFVREVAYANEFGQLPSFFSQLFNSGLGYESLYLIEFLLVLTPFVWFLFTEKAPVRDIMLAKNPDRGDLKYWIFSFVSLGLILFYSIVANIHRYAIPFLPLYWVFAQTYNKNKQIGRILIGLLLSILVIGSIIFATWGWYW